MECVHFKVFCPKCPSFVEDWNKKKQKKVLGKTFVKNINHWICNGVTYKSIGLMQSGDLFLELFTTVETGCHSKQSLGFTRFRAYHRTQSKFC